MPEPFRVPLALAFRVTSISLKEAVAITLTIARRLDESAIPGGQIVVPTAGDVRLSPDGQVHWKHGTAMSADSAGYPLGKLLSRLVEIAERHGERAAPQLKFAIDRSTDEQSAIPLKSLAEFRFVLDRFIPADASEAIAALARRVAVRAAELPADRLATIADLRRARRARGASLGSIAAETGISEPLLHQLEWGVLQNWPAGTHGIHSLRAYADAAGLDPEAVVALVAPELMDVNEVPASAVTRGVAALPGVTPARPLRRLPLVAAAACAVLLLGLGAALSFPQDPAAPLPVPPALHIAASVPPTAPAVPSEALSPVHERRAPAHQRRVMRAGRTPDRPQARPHARHALSAAPKEEANKPKPSFWKRPLLIIKLGGQ